MTNYKRGLPLLLAAVVALTPLVAAPEIWADENELPFDVAKVFVQLNDTDGDLGFHAQIDGEAWTLLKIKDPNIQLPPGVTELKGPETFLALGTAFKVQVLMSAASGNQTSTESCFRTR